MHNLTDPKVIKNLMKKYRVHFSKGLGQNFIVDQNICPDIVHLSGANESVGALEIGPGVGVLTAELAKVCNKVVSVEIDKSLLPLLKETLEEFHNVTIVRGDAMELDLQALLDAEFAGMDVIVCANLPYYITSPIIMHLLETRLKVKSITVMVQKEAAQRICAPMPSRQSGAITAAVRYYSEPQLLLDVPKDAFLPAPKVDSAVIRLDIRDKPPVDVQEEAMLFKVIKGAFSQRRKTILNCLSAFFGQDKAAMTLLLNTAKVVPGARAEQLAMEDFARIADALCTANNMQKQHRDL